MDKKVALGLFDKFSIDALESLETILKYSDKNNELYGIIGNILRKKSKEIDYDGMNEYDTITRVLNFNLSEIKSNVDNLSSDELYILKEILNLAITRISPQAIEESIKPILQENIDVIENKLPEDLSETEIEELLKKCQLLELDALYFICKTAEDIDRDKLIKIANDLYGKKGFKRWQDFIIPINQIDSGIMLLMDNLSKFNKREIKYLAPLVDNSSFHISNIYNSNSIDMESMHDNLIRFRNMLYDEIEFNESNKSDKTKALTIS